MNSRGLPCTGKDSFPTMSKRPKKCFKGGFLLWNTHRHNTGQRRNLSIWACARMPQPFVEVWFRFKLPSILNQIWWKLLFSLLFFSFLWLQSCSLRSNWVILELMSVLLMMKIRRLGPHPMPQERPKLARNYAVVLPLNDCSWKMTLDPIQGCWIWPRRYREVLTTSWGGYRRQGHLQQDSFQLPCETRQNEDCRVAAGVWSCFRVSWRVSQDLCAPRCATWTSRYTVYAL